ncbi:bifunctional 4-hydroxy-2-oxoglutarate aldolase/2-dehydro-3-deoxy-phosphogluconate aldolase [Prochlorococcus marinus]|uniref:bifunctional 4-hydroxy-2-oxoglutarate aldolase/2-dehydro-3-deoxy-phosphogluconate aldolase n=1 Tax=Prochlorococcus marinus TaxID=1219 RepID=UPI001ADA2C73|nr:bifunctional 4-hydroxy-2-oxoglutarate aldolase/2-dehydro-3-deoxy-phosphogluconate aldolase [Prochlorococcus marinus]MBO8220297.1 bifunctional 4-hydroxy-2-oxoglutarate aldolase/2-dehydro-3-deoxy-phosphogluconate aldolase [Prochlorococcus marinus CUG1417]MBW3074930.1 2-dehydro-3-deoxyphosphogluconate aldolase [Prochlorococcus marinus str. MU1417]
MDIKEDSFSDLLLKESFFLLIKPEDKIYLNTSIKNLFFEDLESLVKLGLKNIEISWSNNKNWLDFVSEIKLKYPKINLGSASIVNKQSIEDSLKIGLNFSMMKFWDKDLFNYAHSKNYLLIPGIRNLKDLKEAANLNCNIIKIYPIKSKDSSIDIFNYKNIDFIAAGGLSINDVKTYKSLGYKAIVIGDKAIKNKKFDPKIYEWLKNN